MQPAFDVGFLEPAEFEAASLVDNGDGWDTNDFMEFFHHQNQAVYAAWKNGSVVGYLAYSVRPRHNEIVIVRLSVHQRHRRQGVASALLQAIIGRAAKNPGALLKALVREGQVGAQLCLKKAGFKAQCIKRACFQDTGEDGYGFVREVGAPISV